VPSQLATPTSYMNISRPVLGFAFSGISAALGFVGLLLVVPPKGRVDIPMWQDLLGWFCLALLLVGMVGLIASFAWWIIAGIVTRRKAKPITMR
jgi:hypothetical protein